jgi:hypothetical protein
MVNQAKWEQPGNRGPVRPQSAKKEVEIDKALMAGEARLTMAGYVDEILTTSGVTGTARTPKADTLFDEDMSELVSEIVRVWFHRVVAQLLYLAKRVCWECLPAVSHMAGHAQRCAVRDVEKRHRLVRYIRGTRDLGVVLRPGALGMVVRLFVARHMGCIWMGNPIQARASSMRCRSSALQVQQTRHRGEEQYGGRARGSIQLGQPRIPLKTVSDSAGIQDGSSDPLPGQPVLHGHASKREVGCRTYAAHSHTLLLDQGAC